jgi:signal recognition particle subunit SRP54
MTREERHNPDIINGSRRKRIAKGSGTSVEEVNQLLKQFGEMRTMIRQMSSGKGPWAQMMRQAGGGEGIPGLPAAPHKGGGKKTGKAARKEKRKHKAKSGRR